MPGQLQEGFGCIVTNRFDQLLDDESDPFEILKAAETKKKEGAAAGSTKTAAQAAKQPKKESQKDRKNPLLDKKEESQAPVSLKKEGKYPPTCLLCPCAMDVYYRVSTLMRGVLTADVSRSDHVVQTTKGDRGETGSGDADPTWGGGKKVSGAPAPAAAAAQRLRRATDDAQNAQTWGKQVQADTLLFFNLFLFFCFVLTLQGGS